MIIKKLVSSYLSSNCYLIISDKKAAVIDPSVEPEKILRELSSHDAVITSIIYTHGHVDHIFFGDELKDLCNANTYGHKMDYDLYSDSYKNGSILFGLKKSFDVCTHELKDDDELKTGNEKLKIIHTPGHTMGGICIYVKGNIFTGDTLFYESVGRTDLGTGDWNMLISSIKNRLFTLPDDTKVHPGHGTGSTIKHEKEHNPYVDFR